MCKYNTAPISTATIITPAEDDDDNNNNNNNNTSHIIRKVQQCEA